MFPSFSRGEIISGPGSLRDAHRENSPQLLQWPNAGGCLNQANISRYRKGIISLAGTGLVDDVQSEIYTSFSFLFFFNLSYIRKHGK